MKYVLDLGDQEFAGKMLVETLCAAQTRIASGPSDTRIHEHIQRLQSVIDQIEEQRPDHQTSLKFCGNNEKHPSHPFDNEWWGWKHQCLGKTETDDYEATIT